MRLSAIPAPTRTASLLVLALACGGVFGCRARNVVGELPDGGHAGAGGGGTGGSPTVASCGEIPATSQIPRLTNAQYDRTVRDLLGVTALTARGGVRPSVLLAVDSPAPLSDLAWSAYWLVGASIAAQVMADETLRPRFLACTLTGDGTDCLHDTIVTFGRRAFRRPLTAAEVARFDKIVAARARITPTGAPEEVAQVLLETFLISPSFIQRSEITSSPDGKGRFTLSPYEVASRLSYMLWGSAPDDLLNAAADGGQLATQAQVRAQAVRMLADPRAKEQVAAFHGYYLGQWNGPWAAQTAKDPTRFPYFTGTFAAAADEEMARFFDAIAFEKKGSFQDLLTSPLGFVTRETAPTYGLDATQYGGVPKQVTLDPTQRPGFLTRISFLAAFTQSDSTSPMRRGGYVMRRVLGSGLIPSPGIEPPPSLAPGDGFLTTRARVEALTGGSPCDGCHVNYINPPGYVLEAYDAMGAWRTTEADTGAAIDTMADVTIDGVSMTVSDPKELMTRLAASSDAQHVYARSLVSYAYEREKNALDACTVETLAARMAANPVYPILNLLIDLTQVDAFKLRAREVTP